MDKDKAVELLEGVKIAPSIRAIYSLDKTALLEANSLILFKASSLSSRDRKMVQQRVAYGLDKGTIQMQEVVDDVNRLSDWAAEEIKNKIDDDSSIN
tara:strand:+ start:660 stop:950 length:291 start_codon:yes stop_codon:yes gene_type:complete